MGALCAVQREGAQLLEAGRVLSNGSVACPTDSLHRHWENNRMWFIVTTQVLEDPWACGYCDGLRRVELALMLSAGLLSALRMEFSPQLPGQAQPALRDPWVTVQL